jgi:very-short-patch-repair endonuclease
MDERKMFYGAEKKTFGKAFMLRKNETVAEKLLWQRLRKNQICGLRFKRQHPIAYYVADFYCHKTRLVIELDGGYHKHDVQKLYDKIRTQVMEEFGLRVLRFSDTEIFEDIDTVLEAIQNIALPRSPFDP